MSSCEESGEYPLTSPDAVVEVPSARGESWVLLLDRDLFGARAVARAVARASGMMVRIAVNTEEAVRCITREGTPTGIISYFRAGDEPAGLAAMLDLRRKGCAAPWAVLADDPVQTLLALDASGRDEVVPVFAKTESVARLAEWLDPLGLCWSASA